MNRIVGAQNRPFERKIVQGKHCAHEWRHLCGQGKIVGVGNVSGSIHQVMMHFRLESSFHLRCSAGELDPSSTSRHAVNSETLGGKPGSNLLDRFRAGTESGPESIWS